MVFPNALNSKGKVFVRHAQKAAISRDLENPSSKKEVRPFFLGDNSIWSFPTVSSLSDYSIWGISVHCPQILLSLRKYGI